MAGVVTSRAARYTPDAMQYRFGEFELAPERYELRRGDRTVSVEPRVLEVLGYLVRHADRVVPRRELLDQLWRGVVVSDAVITRAIKEARRAVGQPRRAWIRTVYGRGFQFAGPVAAVPNPGTPDGAIDPGRAAAPTPRPLPSVAVLPFADLSPAHDQGHFCDGLADELIAALTQVEGLFVASRTSSFSCRGSGAGGDIWTLGERLNVASVLEGSVRKDGSRVRVSAQLIRVADSGPLWSGVFDRELSEVFAIQEELAHSVVGALRVVLSNRERLALSSLPRAEPGAYDWYLRGRQTGARSSRSEIEAARQMFLRAVELDPRYAPALAGAAECSAWLHLYWGGAESDLASAADLSRRAVALAPDLADAHMARGLMLAIGGRAAEAAAAFETAIRLNPRVYKIRYAWARTCWVAGDVSAAARHLERAEELNPEYHGVPALLAKVYDRLCRPDAATRARQRCVERAERALAHDPADVRALYLGASALAGLGEAGRAAEWIERARAMAPDDPVLLEYAAAVHARGGRAEAALACLRQAIALGYRHLDWIACEPDFGPLAADSRFRALVQRPARATADAGRSSSRKARARRRGSRAVGAGDRGPRSARARRPRPGGPPVR